MSKLPIHAVALTLLLATTAQADRVAISALPAYQAECAACHDTINPVGFAFEHYDALGIFRTTEQISGLPIDARGALARTGDADGPVSDALELSERLAPGGALYGRYRRCC